MARRSIAVAPLMVRQNPPSSITQCRPLMHPQSFFSCGPPSIARVTRRYLHTYLHDSTSCVHHACHTYPLMDMDLSPPMRDIPCLYVFAGGGRRRYLLLCTCPGGRSCLLTAVAELATHTPHMYPPPDAPCSFPLELGSNVVARPSQR